VRVLSVGLPEPWMVVCRSGMFEPRTVINAADGVRTDVGSGEGILVSSATVADQGTEDSIRQSVWSDCGGYGSGGRGARSAGAGSRVRRFESHLRRCRFRPARAGSLCGDDGSFRSVGFACHVALRPWLWGTTIALARNSSKASMLFASALVSYLGRETRWFSGTGVWPVGLSQENGPAGRGRAPPASCDI
jgi:hypothetical protein